MNISIPSPNITKIQYESPITPISHSPTNQSPDIFTIILFQILTNFISSITRLTQQLSYSSPPHQAEYHFSMKNHCFYPTTIFTDFMLFEELFSRQPHKLNKEILLNIHHQQTRYTQSRYPPAYPETRLIQPRYEPDINNQTSIIQHTSISYFYLYPTSQQTDPQKLTKMQIETQIHKQYLLIIHPHIKYSIHQHKILTLILLNHRTNNFNYPQSDQSNIFNILPPMPLENYQLLEKIGNGKYSIVYKVKRHTDKQLFSLKKVPLLQMEPRSRRNALSQVKILQTLKHNHIVTLHQICYDDFLGHLCMILEYAEQGDLSQQIKRRKTAQQPFKQDQLWQALAQISSGLNQLHEHNILHRDLKSSNILIFNNNQYKISDLNVSVSLENLKYTRTGTLSYASPQIWKGQIYDFKSDIWSLGCLMYQMAALKLPFEGNNVEELSKKIIKCQYTKLGQQYSKQFRDLISFMIQINPKLRPSAKTLHKLSTIKINSAKDNHRLHSLTPFLQRKESQHEFNSVNSKPQKTEANEQSNLKTKNNSKKLIINSQQMPKSYKSSTYCETLPKSFEYQLKNTSVVKQYIYNKLMEQTSNNNNTDNQTENIQYKPKHKHIYIHHRPLNKITRQNRTRRNTEI